MGEVFKAKDTRLGREVAVKVLPAEFAEDPERLRRFKQEARAAAALNHPNILVLYDIGSAMPSLRGATGQACSEEERSDDIGEAISPHTSGLPRPQGDFAVTAETDEPVHYIVTELLEGETLRERLRHGPMASAKAVDFGVQIAQGLAAAHEKGIVHRDLKPENLWLTKDGRIKILDFGLARLMIPSASGDMALSKVPTTDQPTREGMVLGTLGYMAPEQVRGQTCDHRADIFAFGCVLYEMLLGKRAFAKDSAADTFSAILHEEPPGLLRPDAAYPPALVHLVRHCLEKAPEDRFQSAKDIAFALESPNVTSDAGLVIGPPPAEGPRPDSRRFIAVSLAVMALLMAAGTGLFFLGHRSSMPVFPKFTAQTFQKGYIVSARFSPDGNTIYYSAAWGSKPVEVYAKRLDSVQSQPMGIEKGEVLSVSSGEMAVLIRHVETLGAFTLNKGTLARVSLAGGPPRPVLDDVVEADYAPGTTDLAVVLLRGDRRRLEFPMGTLIHEDTLSNLDRVRFSPSGDSMAFLGSLAGEGTMQKDLILADRKGGKRALLSGVPGLGTLAWRPDGKEIYFAQSGTLKAVDMEGRVRLLAVTPQPLTIRDVSLEGSLLVTQDRQRNETFGLLAGDSKQRELSYLSRTTPFTLSEDGTSLSFRDLGGVYLQKADGSTPLRLGAGSSGAISPDGKWAAVAQDGTMRLLPTGAGTPITLPKGNLETVFAGSWLPAGKGLLLTAAEKGQVPNMFVQDLPEGLPRPLADAPVNSLFDAISPDGRWTTAYRVDDPTATYRQYQLDGGTPKAIPGLGPADHPVEYSGDGRHLFVYEPPPGPLVHIARLDLSTGKREPWWTISPEDPAGISSVWQIRVSRNGKFYAVTYLRTLSDLYLVEGVK
jgi:serine/threonine protein kinase